jgi:hypothetical protein
MELIKNLIQHKLIQTGTWLGVRSPSDRVVHHRWRVETLSCDEIWACVPEQGRVVQVPLSHICEVDGMTLERVCAQADLNHRGEKLAPQTRRGRKPKRLLTK